jgi:hypothetical protein
MVSRLYQIGLRAHTFNKSFDPLILQKDIVKLMKKSFGGLYKRKTVSGILFSLGQAVNPSPHLFRYGRTRSIITGRIYPFTG